jgi:hypothetical protein
MKINHQRVSKTIRTSFNGTSSGVTTRRSILKRSTRRLERRVLNASVRHLVMDWFAGLQPQFAASPRSASC